MARQLPRPRIVGGGIIDGERVERARDRARSEYGWTGELLAVGHQQPKNVHAKNPLTGAEGSRLMQLLGMTDQMEYQRCVDRAYLAPRVRQLQKAEQVLAQQARALVDDMWHRYLVLSGPHAARAFGFRWSMPRRVDRLAFKPTEATLDGNRRTHRAVVLIVPTLYQASHFDEAVLEACTVELARIRDLCRAPAPEQLETPAAPVVKLGPGGDYTKAWPEAAPQVDEGGAP